MKLAITSTASHFGLSLEVALEQLINEKDHNCKYSYSGQEPEDIPKDNDYYDSKN